MILRRAALITLLLMVALASSCGRKLPPRWVEPVPATPAHDLTATFRPDSVHLAWQHAGGARFIVQRASDGAAFGDLDVTRERSYADHAGGPQYSYRIAAVNPGTGLESAAMSPAVSAPTQAVPGKPESLAVTISGDLMKLAWAYKGSAIFNVYEGDHGSFDRIAGPLSATSVDLPANPSGSRAYTVRAASGGAVTLEGPPSETVEVGPESFVPSKVLNVQAATSGDGSVLVIWDAAPESWVVGYNVYRTEGAGNYKRVGSSRTPAYADSLSPGVKLSYRVRAVGPEVEGPDSAAAEVNPVPGVIQ